MAKTVTATIEVGIIDRAHHAIYVARVVLDLFTATEHLNLARQSGFAWTLAINSRFEMANRYRNRPDRRRSRPDTRAGVRGMLEQIQHGTEIIAESSRA